MKLPSLWLRRFLPKRIWQQIFCILIFLVIIPLVVLGFLLLRTSQETIQTTVWRDHKEIALHITGEIEEHIKGAKGNLMITASMLSRLHADPWRQEAVIVQLSLENPSFQRISSLDLDGMEVSTSELGSTLRQRSDEVAFEKAASGQSYISEVKISDAHMPFLTLAEPIKEMGKVKGVLIADLSLRSAWNIIDGIQIGQSGMASLIDSQGRIIAHQDKKLVLKNANLKQIQVIEDLLSDQAGSFHEVNEKGEPVITSYAPVEGLKWGLIITQPRKEAYAFLQNMNVHFLFLIFISIAATMMISFMLAHYMSRPLRGMIERTEKISKGDFSHSFRIRSKNEINRLLFSFNRMTKRLRKAREDEKLSIIGKAATAIAHELKNSLQLIDTFVKALPQRHDDQKFIKEFADMMPRELDSWNSSLRNMMTFSKKTNFDVEPLNINELAKEIIFLARLKARQQGVHLSMSLGDHIPMIMGNEEKLKQVFRNIVTNAIEATPAGGSISLVTQLIDKSNSSEHACVKIDVANIGEVIEEEVLNRIFDPFYSTKSGGLGLGLSISKEIVELHSGSITVMSEKGGKTIFTIKIPVDYVPSKIEHIFKQYS